MIEYKQPIPTHDDTKDDVVYWRMNELFDGGLEYVQERLGVIVYDSQKPYIEGIKLEECVQAVVSVMSKREFRNTMNIAINLDVLCEQNQLIGTIQKAVFQDESSFGVDETLINVAQLYGTIAISNAFALDKLKTGVIGEVDYMGKTTEYCTTFLDDILCAIAGSAMGKLAHKYSVGH